MNAIVRNALSLLHTWSCVYVFFSLLQSSSFTLSLHFFFACDSFRLRLPRNSILIKNAHAIWKRKTFNPLIAIVATNRAMSYVDFVTLLSHCQSYASFFQTRPPSSFHLIFTFLIDLIILNIKVNKWRKKTSTKITNKHEAYKKKLHATSKNVCACEWCWRYLVKCTLDKCSIVLRIILQRVL